MTSLALPPYVELVDAPMLTAGQRRSWTLCYQRCVSPARSEVVTHGGRHRVDALALDGTRVEFQLSPDSRWVAAAKERAHAAGVLWLFCAINQHHDGRLRLFRQGSGVGFAWARPWMLPAECNGRILLDLGRSAQVGAHVLLEVDSFDADRGQALGTGVLRGAQEFCRWLRNGEMLTPYLWR